MVTGIRKDMHTCNRAGLIHIQFVTRPEEDVFCFDAYCKAKGSAVDPVMFVSFYASKGWMIGKNKMKDWKQAIYTWEKQRKEEEKEAAKAE